MYYLYISINDILSIYLSIREGFVVHYTICSVLHNYVLHYNLPYYKIDEGGNKKRENMGSQSRDRPPSDYRYRSRFI